MFKITFWFCIGGQESCLNMIFFNQFTKIRSSSFMFKNQMRWIYIYGDFLICRDFEERLADGTDSIAWSEDKFHTRLWFQMTKMCIYSISQSSKSNRQSHKEVIFYISSKSCNFKYSMSRICLYEYNKAQHQRKYRKSSNSISSELRIRKAPKFNTKIWYETSYR